MPTLNPLPGLGKLAISSLTDLPGAQANFGCGALFQHRRVQRRFFRSADSFVRVFLSRRAVSRGQGCPRSFWLRRGRDSQLRDPVHARVSTFCAARIPFEPGCGHKRVNNFGDYTLDFRIRGGTGDVTRIKPKNCPSGRVSSSSCTANRCRPAQISNP